MERGAHQSHGARSYMEDYHSELECEQGLLAGVYDGHGGDSIAEYCSINLLPRVLKKLQQGNDPGKALVDSFVDIDRELSESQDHDSEEDDDEVEPGSTAVVALVQPGLKRLLVASVGDCRAILSRQGKAVDLASPHEPELELERSRIEAAGGKILPNGYLSNGDDSSTLGMSRSIGDFDFKSNRSLPVEQQMVIPIPDVVSVDLKGEEEFLILTSDGIWMESQFLVDFVRARLQKGLDLSEICKAMVDKAEANDNMTAIIIKIS